MKLKSSRSEAEAKAAATRNTKTLTPDQARAEYFPQMGRAAFYGALRRRQIPHVRLGRRIVISRVALETFLETFGFTPAGAA